jgi:hypothetical protein
LLRKPELLDTDEAIQPYVRTAKARLVKGDALSIEDVARGWAEAQTASETRQVDVVLFTVGEHRLSILREQAFTSVQAQALITSASFLVLTSALQTSARLQS